MRRISAILCCLFTISLSAADLQPGELACSDCSPVSGDFNGDGLDDLLSKNRIFFNLGDGFGPGIDTTGIDANDAINVAFQFVLAIVLSFLLVWDLPNTKVRLSKYAEGRTADIYREIVPGLKAFGTMLGRSILRPASSSTTSSACAASGARRVTPGSPRTSTATP